MRDPSQLTTDPSAQGVDPHAPGRSLRAIRAQLADLVARHDMRGALACLNARTHFRFTGLYRVEP
ncbi:MAG TPA: hypothetical protein VGT98_12350, partial [Candidatus Elarobacter sp.]|nr:hypothetical protein [Candidatus Elarobacter sp.]